MKSQSISKIYARFYATCMVIATMLLFASISPAFGPRVQDRDTSTPISGKGVKVTASGTNVGATLDLFNTDGSQLAVRLLKSVAVTSSYARPRVHRESREVRGEARGEHPKTTSSKGLLQTADFNGVWNTVTSTGNKFVMTLRVRQNGVVRGQYKPFDGQIKGTQSGNVLRFTWRQEDGSRGAGRFKIAHDSLSFQGTFSATNNPDDTSGGTWNGTRQ